MKLISYFCVVFFFPGLGGGRPQVRLSGGLRFCLIAIFTVLMLAVAFYHSPTRSMGDCEGICRIELH